MQNEDYPLEVSEEMIKECITDLYINPKKSIVKWSKITNQTAQGKFAYPSQHLASLITKMKGGGSAARGDDLSDGSEVKSCSRADQLNECKKCGFNVLTWQNKCPSCGSSEIRTDTSSHWIFPITSDSEFELLLNKIPCLLHLRSYFWSFGASVSSPDTRWGGSYTCFWRRQSSCSLSASSKAKTRFSKFLSARKSVRIKSHGAKNHIFPAYIRAHRGRFVVRCLAR